MLDFAPGPVRWGSDLFEPSGANNPNTLAFEEGQSVVAGTVIGDQSMDFAQRTNESRTDLAQFTRIRNNDHFFSLFDHLAIDQCFVGLERSHSSFGIEACDAEENLVHIDIVE